MLSLSSEGIPGGKGGICLVLAGGLSNLYDRLRRGYVVGLLQHSGRILKKVVFNLGDLFIMAGAAVLTVKSLFENEAGRKTQG